MTSEWRAQRLGELINSLNAGVSVNSYDYPCSNEEKGVLKTSCISNGKFNYLENKAIIEEEYSRVRLNPLKGEIIISRMNTPELVGEIGFVEETHENIYLPDRLWQTELKDDICGKWLSLVMSTDIIRQQIKSIATGTSNSMKNISKPNLLSIKVNVPPLKEQEKIAQILSTWDLVIEKQEQLIEKKKEFKKGLMQRLLSGEVRFKEFKDEWKVVSLGSVFERVIKKNDIGCDNVLTISAQNGLVNQEEYFNKSVSSKDLSGYYLLSKGDFAYNKSYSNGYPLGAIKRLNNYEEGVVSPLYICFRAKENVSTCFYEQYFESGALNKEIMKIAQEGARNHGLLNISVTEFFKDIKIVRPAIEEQDKIAEVLLAADKEIDLLQKELEALKLQKKGLMQRLLTGEVRVKV